MKNPHLFAAQKNEKSLEEVKILVTFHAKRREVNLSKYLWHIAVMQAERVVTYLQTNTQKWITARKMQTVKYEI